MKSSVAILSSENKLEVVKLAALSTFTSVGCKKSASPTIIMPAATRNIEPHFLQDIVCLRINLDMMLVKMSVDPLRVWYDDGLVSIRPKKTEHVPTMSQIQAGIRTHEDLTEMFLLFSVTDADSPIERFSST